MVNGIGYLVGRIVLANVILFVVLLAYEVYMFATYYTFSELALWWPTGLTLVTLLPLNAWAFSRWMSNDAGTGGPDRLRPTR